MDNPPRRTNNYTNDHFHLSHKVFGQGGCAIPKHRLLLLSLGLLNVVLFISAVVIGINCTKIKQSSVHYQHPVVVQLLTELHNVRNNYSEMFLAEHNAIIALEDIVKNQSMLQDQIKQKKINNDGYLKQLEALQTERTALINNISSFELSCAKCPPGFTHYNTSCYFFSSYESLTLKKNWHNSRADCINRGSDLVVIDSPEEQAFLSNNVRKMITGRLTWENGFWVGLNDIDTEGVWVWINNVTEVETRYWADGEPNNHGQQGGEDCALIIHSNANPWKTRFDAKCQQHELHWICETLTN